LDVPDIFRYPLPPPIAPVVITAEDSAVMAEASVVVPVPDASTSRLLELVPAIITSPKLLPAGDVLIVLVEVPTISSVASLAASALMNTSEEEDIVNIARLVIVLRSILTELVAVIAPAVGTDPSLTASMP
jgi:hypothetical protein